IAVAVLVPLLGLWAGADRNPNAAVFPTAVPAALLLLAALVIAQARVAIVALLNFGVRGSWLGFNAIGSKGRSGTPSDNAVVESFFASLQTELLDRHTWPTRDRLRTAIFEYIESFYNRHRQRRVVRGEMAELRTSRRRRSRGTRPSARHPGGERLLRARRALRMVLGGRLYLTRHGGRPLHVDTLATCRRCPPASLPGTRWRCVGSRPEPRRPTWPARAGPRGSADR